MIFVKQIKTENKVSDKLEADTEGIFLKMSWISLPVYEGFNQFAIWPSEQSVSKARFKNKDNVDLLSFKVVKF